MLAYAGPDSVVKLSLLTNAIESPCLEIRRYDEVSECRPGGELRLGLDLSKRMSAVPERSTAQNHVDLHAVSLQSPELTRLEISEEVESPVTLDLRALLPEGAEGWILQPRLNGRVQRAAVWFPSPQPHSSRVQRIRDYEEEWRRLATGQERAEWRRRWELIQAVSEGGDAGILDQAQALAQAPAAAVRLLLAASKADLPQALALEMAAPILWPALPAAAFTEALEAEYIALNQQLANFSKTKRSLAKQPSTESLNASTRSLLCVRI
jgi:hypothetical protein